MVLLYLPLIQPMATSQILRWIFVVPQRRYAMTIIYLLYQLNLIYLPNPMALLLLPLQLSMVHLRYVDVLHMCYVNVLHIYLPALVLNRS